MWCLIGRHPDSACPARIVLCSSQYPAYCRAPSFHSRPRHPLSAQDEYTPLHLAVYNGHCDVAAALLENGADIEAKNKVRTEGSATPSIFHEWHQHTRAHAAAYALGRRRGLCRAPAAKWGAICASPKVAGWGAGGVSTNAALCILGRDEAIAHHDDELHSAID